MNKKKVKNKRSKLLKITQVFDMGANLSNWTVDTILLPLNKPAKFKKEKNK